jgi:RimJ/RimL family protein N-acetyltransferase
LPSLTRMRLTLRPAADSDAALLRSWRNDPDTRAASRNTAEVEEAEHESWLAGVLADAGQRLFVAEQDGRPVGQVRLQRADDAWEISVTVSPEARGAGLGAALIEGGVERLRAEGAQGAVEAWVRAGNAASLGAFRRGGFSEEPERSNADYTLLTREL